MRQRRSGGAAPPPRGDSDAGANTPHRRRPQVHVRRQQPSGAQLQVHAREPPGCDRRAAARYARPLRMSDAHTHPLPTPYTVHTRCPLPAARCPLPAARCPPTSSTHYAADLWKSQKHRELLAHEGCTVQCVVGFRSDDVTSPPLQFVLEAEVHQHGHHMTCIRAYVARLPGSRARRSSSPRGHPAKATRQSRGPPDSLLRLSTSRPRRIERGAAFTD